MDNQQHNEEKSLADSIQKAWKVAWGLLVVAMIIGFLYVFISILMVI